jgi:hypothetical protein
MRVNIAALPDLLRHPNLGITQEKIKNYLLEVLLLVKGSA